MENESKKPIAGEGTVAARNRELFQQNAVFALLITGGTGCGKTALIARTAAELMPEIHLGVLTVGPVTNHDADRILPYSDLVAQVNPRPGHPLCADDVGAALHQLPLRDVDLLLVEDISSLVEPLAADIGQHATAGMFSVATGDDKPAKYPRIVERSDVLLLNKIDLLPHVPFNLSTFHVAVRRLNPNALIFELSALTGEGMPTWFDWLKRRVDDQRRQREQQ